MGKSSTATHAEENHKQAQNTPKQNNNGPIIDRQFSPGTSTEALLIRSTCTITGAPQKRRKVVWKATTPDKYIYEILRPFRGVYSRYQGHICQYYCFMYRPSTRIRLSCFTSFVLQILVIYCAKQTIVTVYSTTTLDCFSNRLWLLQLVIAPLFLEYLP